MNGKEGYIIILDAGTGSGRCLIFDTTGRQVGFAQEDWLPINLPEFPGSQQFDLDQSWSVLCRCIRSALRSADIDVRKILGITSTSMREGMVLYDTQGRELWACPNVDARAQQETKEMITAGLGPEMYKISGDWLNITNPPRFRWIRKHRPDLYKKVAHMTMISDWVLYKLSGELVSDPSIASSSGLFDIAERKWSERIVEITGVPAGIYPQVVESGNIIGKVTKQAATDTGLRVGIPVVTGGADTQLALVGVGSIEPGDFTVVGGTFWQTTVVTDSPLIDKKCRLRTLCHIVRGLWMTEGIGFYHGFTTRWFRDAFCQEEKRLAQILGLDPYQILEQMAQTVPPGSNGIIAIFSDVMNAKCWIHAAPAFMQFDVLSPSLYGKKEFFRALEENAVYVSYGNYEVLLEIYGKGAEQIIFCGGSSKGFLWPQILADVYSIPVRVPAVKESSALGGAMCVGVAIGVASDLHELRQKWVRWERELIPNPDNHEIYMTCYRKWRQVYQHCLEMASEGLTRPMWRAPGILNKKEQT